MSINASNTIGVRRSDTASEVDRLIALRMATAERPGNDTNGVVVERVNNSLQALMNLFYVIAREASLEPQLQPLVTQVQAELAQLSRWIHKLGPQAARAGTHKEQ